MSDDDTDNNENSVKIVNTSDIKQIKKPIQIIKDKNINTEKKQLPKNIELFRIDDNGIDEEEKLFDEMFDKMQIASPRSFHSGSNDHSGI